MKAFWFSKQDCKLQYGDGRMAEVGVTHTVEGELVLCERGLHASKRLLDAVKYAPDSMLWLVDVDGCIDGQDKLCGRSRTYLAKFNAEDVLREFARKQALINIEKIKPHCSQKNYDLIIQWLETGDMAIKSAARSAAESAANEILVGMIKQATGWDI